MFDPRPPLVWKPPTSKRKAPYVTGCADLVACFEKGPPPPVEPYETPKQRHARLREAKMKANEEKIAEELKSWDPNSDPNVTADAYKTLFVANMSYDTTEKKLRREFEQFGPITSIRVVTDKDEQPRGYAFIEFESDEAMRAAYKKADGRKVRTAQSYYQNLHAPLLLKQCHSPMYLQLIPPQTALHAQYAL
jgi:U1 small nuclear ribonucleoprotein 70kDa